MILRKQEVVTLFCEPGVGGAERACPQAGRARGWTAGTPQQKAAQASQRSVMPTGSSGRVKGATRWGWGSSREVTIRSED